MLLSEPLSVTVRVRNTGNVRCPRFVDPPVGGLVRLRPEHFGGGQEKGKGGRPPIFQVRRKNCKKSIK
jgi:hypothetical protein